MGLIAWYSLDASLLDASGNNNHLTYQLNSGKLVTNTSGKIGSCYERAVLNDGQDYFRSTNMFNLADDFTMACWAYVTTLDANTANGLVSNHDYSMNKGAGINVRYISATDFRISCSTGDGSSRTFQSYYGTSNIKDKWSHLLLRFEKETNNLSLWVNGIKEFEMTYAMAVSTNYITLFQWSVDYVPARHRPACKMNDVRIYDHALSTKEIKELAKAKVLHYNFDEFQEPTVNLIPSAGTFSSGWTSYNNGYTSANTINEYGYESLILTNKQSWCGAYKAITLPSAGTYTLSVYVKVISRTNTAIGANLYTNGGGISDTAISADWSTSLIGTWQKISMTRTYTTTSLTVFLICYGGADAPGYEISAEYTMPQIEAKTYSTPFTVGTRDSIVRDVSGYQHDATLDLTTTPRWVTDCKLGSGAYYFKGAGDYIPINIPSVLPGLFNCTVSFWRKNDTTITYWLPFAGQNSSYYLMATGGGTGAFYHNACGVPKIYKDGAYEAGATPFTDQNWHLYTVTNVDFSTWTALNLSKYNGGGSIWDCEGYFDDVRIYNTELSDEAIMDLFKIKASISDTGNLYVAEVRQDISRYDQTYKNINLVKNGSAELGDTTNFNGFTYSADGGMYNSRCFKALSNYVVACSNRYIKINKNNTYFLSAYFKSIGTTSPPLLFGAMCYDKNGSFIGHDMVHHFTNTRTTLAVELVNGATTVQLTSSANWVATSPGVQASDKKIIFWRNDNDYPVYTYSRLTDYYLTVTGNTLTLNSPWAGGTVPVGTPVANNYDGGTYNYWQIQYLTTNWTELTKTVTGWGINDDSIFRYGTEYILIMFLLNYNTGDCQTAVDDIKFFNLDEYETQDVTQGFSEKGVLNASEISEIGVTEGLIAYYPLDNNTLDYSGYNRHGTANGAIPSKGVKGGGYYFDGANDTISFGIGSDFFPLTQFSISIWFSSDGTTPVTGTCPGIIGFTYGFRVLFNGSTGQLSYRIFKAVGSEQIDQSTTQNYFDSLWHHVVATCNGSDMKLYIDGVYQSQGDVSDFWDGSTSWPASTWCIGRDLNNEYLFFRGCLDELRIYDRELTQKEVSILYDLDKTSTMKMVNNTASDTIYVSGEIIEI